MKKPSTKELCDKIKKGQPKKKTLDEIIEEFITKIEDLQPLFTYTSTGELIEDQPYTCMEEQQ